MFTPISITSMNQGKDLAHWHIRKLYDEPVSRDIERREAGVELAVEAESIDPPHERRTLAARLIWCLQATGLTMLRQVHRKKREILTA